VWNADACLDDWGRMNLLRLNHTERLAVLATVLASVAVTGIVEAPLAGAAASAPDACTLLAPHDLLGVLHGTVTDGSTTALPDGTESICEWLVSPNAKHGYGAELHVYARRHAMDFKQQRRISSAPTHTVKHVGDAAFSERVVLAGQVYDDLWVRTGTTIFRIETLRDVGTKPLVKLARIAVKNLRSA